MNFSPDSLEQRDIDHSLHQYTHLERHRSQGPFIVGQGDGVYVHGTDGRRYLEGMSGLWCAGLGFSEQRLVDAALNQFKELPYGHLFAHRSNAPSIELCERLVQRAPDGIDKAFLVNSGSEAVDAAIKFAWYYHNARGKPQKRKFIARERAYHGVTVASGSLTGLAYAHDGFGLPAIEVIRTATPHHYRYSEDGESEEAFCNRLLDQLESQIAEHGADTIAAFIAEPVMGAGGVLLAPNGYFDKVQALLKKNDILFIADEVITGFGRTGQFFGSELYGIEPDMMTLAKQLSAAYLPIGAVLVSAAVYEALASVSDRYGMFGTGHTYGGHPVAAAVALEAQKIYAERDIASVVRARSERFGERLQALGNHPLVGQARGIGLIGAIELVRDKDTREQYPVERKVAAALSAACQANGVLLRPLPGDNLAFCPPMIISDEEIDELFDAVADALNTVQSQLGGS